MGKATGRKAEERQARLSATTGKFTTTHKHPRRTSRPIIEKSSKAARQRTEAVACAIKATELQVEQLRSKLRLLEKLLGRQKASGKGDAPSTQEQINELRTQMAMKQEEIRSMVEEHESFAEGGEAVDES